MDLDFVTAETKCLPMVVFESSRLLPTRDSCSRSEQLGHFKLGSIIKHKEVAAKVAPEYLGWVVHA